VFKIRTRGAVRRKCEGGSVPGQRRFAAVAWGEGAATTITCVRSAYAERDLGPTMVSDGMAWHGIGESSDGGQASCAGW